MNYHSNQSGAPLEPNAYTLFLIFILLILGTNRDFETKLYQLSNVLSGSLSAVKMMRAGVNEFHASIAKNNDPE